MDQPLQHPALPMTEILQFPYYEMRTITGPMGISQDQLSYAAVMSTSQISVA